MFSIALGLSISAHAQVAKYGMAETDIPVGLVEGEVVKDLTFTNHLGEVVELNTAVKEGPVVITFYRGNWCPYCSKALAALSDSIDMITANGATLLAISPESQEELLLTSEEVASGINLVADANGDLMRFFDVDFDVTTEYQEKLDRMGLPNLQEHNQQERSVLPVPAVYVLNANGEIVWRYFNLDYHQRASVQSIVTAVSVAK